ncbi:MULTISPECIES: thiamine-phosphate kinase [Aeribacillus]|jgi:thiamine-monophosphate kinase|uniref:Thiamine-monophosphate kinase n=2 Tax=Aeribacillus TaxID=1055323 RepID=A0A165X508_9BACI|nr:MULTISPECIES: thiamine-phosphate kinase [Aeribacillus]REJ21900.1 MAG: thiamine-phosphate kinase [Bacillaceae bacterium]ASS90004.1 thiamine-phosphate kinase [Aeribacillus pallidus]KZM55977.1 thiamine-monophosphate kinase [Aeribacillus pallidus]KZN95641.1 thiamine-phosphate kinase [Aeribacillus pallidus]MDR9797356.1 thiamine-phosphate kinase [Aeribacillus pallidus]
MSIQDEFEFIRSIRPAHYFHEGLVVGIGDDAAVYTPNKGFQQIVCTDTMVEGVHFLRKTMEPFDIGFKCLAVNISDIAAMGGIPKYFLVSIAIPSRWHEKDLQSIYKGMADAAEKYKVDLIGGDTVSIADHLVITVTLIGEVERGKAQLRSSARPGDVVFVTGTLGDSAAGLHLLLNDEFNLPEDDYQYLVSRHRRPKPQVKAGRIISEVDRASLNDISDGIASELNEIADMSNVQIVVHKDLLPLSDSIQLLPLEKQFEWAITGGEDFELVGTTSKHSFEVLKKKCEQEGIRITKIGEVFEGSPSVYLQEKNIRKRLLSKGYNHFKKGDSFGSI